jgi:hypothetical protein
MIVQREPLRVVWQGERQRPGMGAETRDIRAVRPALAKRAAGNASLLRADESTRAMRS